MSRFHVHVHVVDLDANIRFYSQLFGAEPAVVKPDYAKWMLDDPRLNFAISNPHDGKVPGLAHLGLQAETNEALTAIGDRLKTANAAILAETATTCCYAKSDKYWAEDPQGLQWESFHSHGEATTYFAAVEGEPVVAAACCSPSKTAQSCANSEIPSCALPIASQMPAPDGRVCCS